VCTAAAIEAVDARAVWHCLARFGRARGHR
jgi:hypothetical protein